jgi:hypothetical protein
MNDLVFQGLPSGADKAEFLMQSFSLRRCDSASGRLTKTSDCELKLTPA